MPRHRPRQNPKRQVETPPAEVPPASRPPRAWQPRFGMGGLFLVVLIVSVMAAAGSYLAKMIFVTRPQDGRQAQLVFLLFTMAAPPLLVVLIAAFIGFVRRR